MKERGESLMLSENEELVTGPGAGFDGLSRYIRTCTRTRAGGGRGDGGGPPNRRGGIVAQPKDDKSFFSPPSSFHLSCRVLRPCLDRGYTDWTRRPGRGFRFRRNWPIRGRLRHRRRGSRITVSLIGSLFHPENSVSLYDPREEDFPC